MNAHIRKTEQVQINNLMLYLRVLEKKEQHKSVLYWMQAAKA